MEPKNRIWNAASALQKRQTPLDRGVMKRTVGDPENQGGSGLHEANGTVRCCKCHGVHVCPNAVTDTSGYARQSIDPTYRLYTWQEAHDLIERGYTMTQDVTLKNTNFVLWRKRDGKQEHLTPSGHVWLKTRSSIPAGMQQLIERGESNGFVITDRESF